MSIVSSPTVGVVAEQAYEAGPTEPALIPLTIPAQLAATALEYPDVEAVVSVQQGIRWTYQEFRDRVTSLAAGLSAAGLRHGDRLGLWAPNCAEWILVQFATAELGVILVNVNPAYRSNELAYAINQSGARWVIAAESFKGSSYVDMLTAVTPNCPSLERVVYLGSVEWETLVATGEPVDNYRRVGPSLEPDQAINIQYTSGTTGFPKGATLTHRNILNNGHFTVVLQRLGAGDRICIPVPFYHCFGMVMGNLGAISVGATMVIPGEGFDPGAVLKAVQDERCTALYGVPTMFIAELAHPEFADFDLSSLRTGVMAGSPCPVEVMKQCIERMHMSEVTICYGMTETSPVSMQTRAEDTIEHRTATVGRAHPHVEVRIVDPVTGETLSRGAIGEFCTRGYSVMKGYWQDDARTAEAIDAEGWMHTGDLAVMDADGYCSIVGRIKDMVIRGGENIYPREIEEFLHTHPDVEDVQVIGVPDERWGEELMAWVRLRPGAQATVEELRDFARERIAHFKVPRYIKFVESFPMTVTGKVRKVEMRRLSVQELDL